MSCDPLAPIFAAFAERGGEGYGEDVSQLDHALQCAALAERDAAPPPLIAAALLHDFGHLSEDRGDAAAHQARDARHEIHGARALRRWFGPEVFGPVALHVLAKRYLCATVPAYAAALSPASQLSLTLQGGAFTPVQCARFARTRFAEDAVRLRRWDDTGKTPGLPVPPLDHYRPLLANLLSPDA
ncbi:phosphonate degradation HD-domain oxygenase [Phenylobacterium sp.]|jgi:phosphonate degradation associated HDIG domain protein|uniref:phosphonate degradation HD-domain oxygenase n=1 Tax=Phenylobacterium sp. TaxID=1871053 RepID=UPI002E33075B|nr:phosphonate degradation HD-domain oxygenase [Phenylobacterium sp.]HEX3364429.1 HD domain-containing protein [Phenylobacterium sp.]